MGQCPHQEVLNQTFVRPCVLLLLLRLLLWWFAVLLWFVSVFFFYLYRNPSIYCKTRVCLSMSPNNMPCVGELRVYDIIDNRRGSWFLRGACSAQAKGRIGTTMSAVISRFHHMGIVSFITIVRVGGGGSISSNLLCCVTTWQGITCKEWYLPSQQALIFLLYVLYDTSIEGREREREREISDPPVVQCPIRTWDCS